MSELPKCRLCGCTPIRLIDGSVKHDEYASRCSLRLAVLKGEEWLQLMGGGEPVSHQFFDPGTNRWHDFMSDKHRRDTADAGYEIRALYTHPAPAVDGAVVQDAARYRWLRDSKHLGAWLSAGNSHMSYPDNIDADIDATMKGEG